MEDNLLVEEDNHLAEADSLLVGEDRPLALRTQELHRDCLLEGRHKEQERHKELELHKDCQLVVDRLQVLLGGKHHGQGRDKQLPDYPRWK